MRVALRAGMNAGIAFLSAPEPTPEDDFEQPWGAWKGRVCPVFSP
jgi:hypothetical protein